MKKAIVVGATSGLGRGISKLLVDNDYKVGITGRRANMLNEIKKEKPEFYIIKTFDTVDTNSISNHLNELTQELGGLDLLIINSSSGDLNDNLDFEIEKSIIDTNVSEFTAIADWTFNYFNQQNYGHLVSISSVAGLRGSRRAPSYFASKAFQINYLEGLRQKARKIKCPIYITDIRPGFVETDMEKRDDMFWASTVVKASTQIFKAILTKRKIVYITKRWRIIALLLKLLPNWIYDKL
jgi:short-subunit dehydrogenase